jgi:hypothetical protein
MREKKTPVDTVTITLDSGDKVRVGKYDSDAKTFYYAQFYDKEFNQKLGAWGLDEKVVDFLVERRAKVVLKDMYSKWEYTVSAANIKVEGTLVPAKGKDRSKYYLPLEKWTVIKAKDRSYVVKCAEEDCKHNFYHSCLRGVIEIGEDGQCSGYEDK